MEPVFAIENGIPIDIIRSKFRYGAGSAVIYDLGGAHRSAGFQVVDAKALALPEDIACIDAELPDVVDAGLSNLIVRDGGDEGDFFAEVGERNRNVALAAAVRRLKFASLRETLPAIGCQAQHPVLGQTIAEAQEELTESLISLAGVQGTGIGEYEGRPCINVMVVRKTQDLLDRIPTTYEGFPVVVIETGELRIHEEDRP